MTEAQEIEIALCKELSADLLTEPVVEWCDTVKAQGYPVQYAYTSLALLFASLLAGAAQELGLNPSAKAIGEMVTEALEKELDS